MSEDAKNALYDFQKNSLERYKYYLQGLDVVSIGYIITQSDNIPNTQIGLIALASVGLLSLSFLCGLGSLWYIRKSVNYNILLIEFNSPDPAIVSKLDELRKEFKHIKRFGVFCGTVQSLFMLLGLLTYFAFVIINKLTPINIPS